MCKNAFITETFTNLSWTPDKMKENDFNVIVKYVCAAYDPHKCFHKNNVVRLQFFLFAKPSNNNLEKHSPISKALQLNIYVQRMLLFRYGV